VCMKAAGVTHLVSSCDFLLYIFRNRCYSFTITIYQLPILVVLVIVTPGSPRVRVIIHGVHVAPGRLFQRTKEVVRWQHGFGRKCPQSTLNRGHATWTQQSTLLLAFKSASLAGEISDNKTKKCRLPASRKAFWMRWTMAGLPCRPKVPMRMPNVLYEAVPPASTAFWRRPFISSCAYSSSVKDLPYGS
jgi:hypothetical protein